MFKFPKKRDDQFLMNFGFQIPNFWMFQIPNPWLSFQIHFFFCPSLLLGNHQGLGLAPGELGGTSSTRVLVREKKPPVWEKHHGLSPTSQVQLGSLFFWVPERCTAPPHHVRWVRRKWHMENRHCQRISC